LLVEEGTRTADDAVGDEDAVAFGLLRLPGERLHFKFSLVKWAHHDSFPSKIESILPNARRNVFGLRHIGGPANASIGEAPEVIESDRMADARNGMILIAIFFKPRGPKRLSPLNRRGPRCS
jgi:hypothetical protein